jgi:hypothetical protein
MPTRFMLSVLLVLATSLGAIVALAQDAHQLPADHLSKTHARFVAMPPHNSSAVRSNANGTPGVDSLSNWNGSFKTPGFDENGNYRDSWVYNMVGNPPQKGGTTNINAPVVPVALDLLNPDGTVFLHYEVKPYILPTLQSPLFENSTFSSSPTPTQITDAIMRAEFWSVMAPDWHTMLLGSLKQERTMQVPAGYYYYALKSNGDCCLYVLIDINEFGNLLFPSVPTDTTTPIGAAENAGDITTKDLSTFLFPNTYLYFGNPNNCCVLGYHSYDVEPGDSSNGNKQRRYVVAYAAWISPGLFGSAFVDVTGLGHEIAESFNDPFVVSDNKHNLTPWWLSPNGNCQDDLEVGDVIEGLPHAAYPIKMSNGMTYHPQNVALLPWFEFQSPSTAIDGAYSYPDENVLPSLSPIELPGCPTS